MGKQSYFFPHDYEPTTDPKILALLSEYGALGYGLYWRIIEMLHSDENHQLPTKKYVAMAIAKQMLITPDQVLKFIDDCVNDFFLLKQENDFIFCDRVFRNINKQQEIINKRKVAGSLGGIANAKQKEANAKQSLAIKVNESKVNKSKKERKEFIAPSAFEVNEYFLLNGYSEAHALKAFNYYNNAGWKDSNNKQVLNWKQKFNGNWFKDEGKITSQQNNQVASKPIMRPRYYESYPEYLYACKKHPEHTILTEQQWYQHK